MVQYISKAMLKRLKTLALSQSPTTTSTASTAGSPATSSGNSGGSRRRSSSGSGGSDHRKRSENRSNSANGRSFYLLPVELRKLIATLWGRLLRRGIDWAFIHLILNDPHSYTSMDVVVVVVVREDDKQTLHVY